MAITITTSLTPRRAIPSIARCVPAAAGRALACAHHRMHASSSARSARTAQSRVYSCVQLIAVLDIDSELLAAFDEVDKEALEALMAKWF